MTTKNALDHLNDALVEDILSLTDEEILAEVIEDGGDPKVIADRMRLDFEGLIVETEQTR